MSSSLAISLRVGRALMARNIYIILRSLYKPLIDGMFLVLTNCLVFGYLLPVIGMPERLIGPAFIGSLHTILFNIAYGFALRIVFDLKMKRFIDYQLNLPISYVVLAGTYILSWWFECIITSAPIVFFGIFILKSKIALAPLWIPFVILYLVSMLFLSLFFCTLALYYDYDWFHDNIWPRRLSPLLIAGCAFAPWHAIYTLNPFLGRLFLLNPVTYSIEGWRSSLLSRPEFINPWICIAVLTVTIVLLSGLFLFVFKKRLNPVDS